MDKNAWLQSLAKFIVEANKNTWAADAPEVEPQRPGYNELEYKSSDGSWLLRDSYSGYFRAPGMTTVYYKSTPAWVMAYGGSGMNREAYHLVENAFEFLKAALMKVSSDLPLRGPSEYREEEWIYTFEVSGDIEDCIWTERITFKGEPVFTQSGFAGIVIDKSPDRKQLYPWDL